MVVPGTSGRVKVRPKRGTWRFCDGLARTAVSGTETGTLRRRECGTAEMSLRVDTAKQAGTRLPRLACYDLVVEGTGHRDRFSAKVIIHHGCFHDAERGRAVENAATLRGGGPLSLPRAVECWLPPLDGLRLPTATASTADVAIVSAADFPLWWSWLRPSERWVLLLLLLQALRRPSVL